jgi:hypothetical protein
MSFNKIIKREVEVAFSKHAQPIWFRILKYILLGFFLYFFWRSKLFWIILLIVFVFGMILHFWYRHKTQGWTKSHGLWKYEKNKPKQEN